MYDVPETITRLNPSTGLYETVPVPVKTVEETKNIVLDPQSMVQCNKPQTTTKKRVSK